MEAALQVCCTSFQSAQLAHPTSILKVFNSRHVSVNSSNTNYCSLVLILQVFLESYAFPEKS